MSGIPEGSHELRRAEEEVPGRPLASFGASLNYVDSETAFARTTRFATERDFLLTELEDVERLVVSRIADVEGEDRRLTPEERKACPQVPDFLVTLKQMIDEIVQENRGSLHRCYLYNARRYTISTTRLTPVARQVVRLERKGGERTERTYRDLVEARFQILNHETGEKTSFVMRLGTSGSWRGAPLPVVYQPSWWIRIFHNLEPVGPEGPTSPPRADRR